MKRFILLTVFSFIFNSSVSQNYKVIYNFEQFAKNINLKTTIKSYLEGDGDMSIYEEDFQNSRSKGNEEDEMITLNKNPIFFKDLRDNIFCYSDQIRFKYFTIKDKINPIDWQLMDESKIILGYSCQKASCNFRGRQYYVFFTNEIPIQDGPWKLIGLPGLILEATSDDTYASFKITVEKLDFSQEGKSYTNVYRGKESITFQEFKSLYKNKYDESLFKVINQEGETRPMGKGFREYYIE
jgi:GLPGLI family protein